MGLIYLDFETRSQAELKSVGGHVYASDPTTEIICAAALLDPCNGEACRVIVWTPFEVALKKCTPNTETLLKLRVSPDALEYEFHTGASDLPRPVRKHVEAGWPVVAHNAFGFDKWIWKAQGWPEPSKWYDTADRAPRRGLPKGLDKIARHLYGIGKDKAGQRTMLMLARPRKGKFLAPDSARLSITVRYCIQDVILMLAFCEDEGLLEPHPDDAIYEAHRAIDARGILIDRDRAQGIQGASGADKMAALAACPVPETMLRSPKALLKWLEKEGVSLPNVKKQTVVSAMEGIKEPHVLAVLNARLAIVRVTDGKVSTTLDRIGTDGRIRGICAYWGAHTGRWAGRGLQPQNLPRPVKGVKDQDEPEDAPRIASELGVEVSDILGSMIRGMIIGPRLLAVADYSSIELRGIAWLAGDEKALDVFRRGEDPYKVMASKLFGVPVDQITGQQRQIGKVACLGSSYQAGPVTLGEFAKGYGVDFESVGLTAADVVYGWRDENTSIAGTFVKWWIPEGQTEKIPIRAGGLWKAYGKAAMDTVRFGDTHEAGKCVFAMDRGHMVITLPSGRELVYRNARIEEVETQWGGKQKAVTYETTFGFRNPTYGGKISENCLAGDTFVCTDSGWVKLKDITRSHKVWDGVEYVDHGGLLDQGKKEVGTWLGVRLTGDHLILVGKKWRHSILLRESSTRYALKTGHDSAHWSCWSRKQASRAGLRFSVIAVLSTLVRLGHCVGERPSAANAGGTGPELAEAKRWRQSCLGLTSELRGYVVEAVQFLGATILSARHFQTTEGEGSEFTRSGLTLGRPGWNTFKRWIGGKRKDSTLTELTTIGGMSRAIYDLWKGKRTAATDAIVEKCLDSISPWQNFKNDIPQSGRWGTSIGTWLKDVTDTLSWQATGKERVYDILNCGPRKRFMILTDFGPIIVHNCTQAICRDLLGYALVNLEAAGLRTVLHVHDEVIVEIDEPSELDSVLKLMTKLPDWAEGFPLAAEGSVKERYGK